MAEKKWNFAPAKSLTGLDGSTSQTGLNVVRGDDPAITFADLEAYRIFFGPANCDEKSAAPMALLKEFEINVADEPETCSACSEAASELMALPTDAKAAAVISSYAAAFLEGCGTIKKGDLRVIGESDPVPFITAFVNEKIGPSIREKLESGLFSVNRSPDLLKHLETCDGFVPFRSAPASDEGADSGARYDDLSFGNHVSLISDGHERFLVFSDSGALHLFRLTDGQIQLAATAKLTDDKVDGYSHPALVGDRFYVRLGKKIACFILR